MDGSYRQYVSIRFSRSDAVDNGELGERWVLELLNDGIVKAPTGMHLPIFSRRYGASTPRVMI